MKVPFKHWARDHSWIGKVWLTIPIFLLCGIFVGCRDSSDLRDSTPDQSGDTEDRADAFSRLMASGRTYYETDNYAQAQSAFESAQALFPTDADVTVNLANTFLRLGELDQAIEWADRFLTLEDNAAAGYFIKGCSLLRKGENQQAIAQFQQALNLDGSVAAVSFLLGRAYFESGNFEEASSFLEEATALDPEHPTAFYLLSQSLIRLGRPEEAQAALAVHQGLSEANEQGSQDASILAEACLYTEIRAPFPLEQPELEGITVRFEDATEVAFGGRSSDYSGPIGVIDVDRRGQNDLFVQTVDGFQLLMNTTGVFEPHGFPYPHDPEGRYKQTLVADLANNRYQDVVILGEKMSHVYKFQTNGYATDVTQFCGLRGLTAKAGALVDMDFTGNLDLVTVGANGEGMEVFRNFGNMYFQKNATSGVPARVEGAISLSAGDWNSDDLADLVVNRQSAQPLMLVKERGGSYQSSSDRPSDWPAADASVSADFNNDLNPDMAFLGGGRLSVDLSSVEVLNEIGTVEGMNELHVVDFDNDGWTDLLATGKGVRVWRNLGEEGFKEVTDALGLNALEEVTMSSVCVADFDCDGDSDLIFDGEEGLRFFRNLGGDANHMLKVRLFGNRSNASGLGVKLEIQAGTWRTSRQIDRLPVEIGTGQYGKLDSVAVRWVNLNIDQVDVETDPCTPEMLVELILPTGSCPYLYAWDGESYRFVSDFLGSSPLGLRLTDDRFVDADPHEYIWIGNKTNFKSQEGAFEIRITEELQEVLYLDQAALVAVDHDPDVEIYPTSKLLPSKEHFIPHRLVPLGDIQVPQRALTLDGKEVTELLRDVDGRRVSPQKLLGAHYRGLAEKHGVVLDFGPINTSNHLALGMTGWLHFGGATANVLASLNKELPFPFPVLEAETSDGTWRPVDVMVGAPAGKTKRMMVDLGGKLPSTTKRLRLSASFEIHWDQIALYRVLNPELIEITRVSPSETDLHWRGYSERKELGWDWPLTPDYSRVSDRAPWRLTPSGWATRYGGIDNLVDEEDDALVLVAGGDELALRFPEAQFPVLAEKKVRDYFLYSVGWDKDADPHCASGTTIEPLPWGGMDDQRYGEESRPGGMNEEWVERYNTRWIGPRTLGRNE